MRDLLLLPGAPRRLLDDLAELKELVRELLVTEEELTHSSQSMDRKVSALEATNAHLEKALEELGGFNSRLEHLDTRVERLEQEIHLVRTATDEIKDLVPDLGRGPLAKARDALTSD